MAIYCNRSGKSAVSRPEINQRSTLTNRDMWPLRPTPANSATVLPPLQSIRPEDTQPMFLIPSPRSLQITLYKERSMAPNAVSGSDASNTSGTLLLTELLGQFSPNMRQFYYNTQPQEARTRSDTTLGYHASEPYMFLYKLVWAENFICEIAE